MSHRTPHDAPARAHRPRGLALALAVLGGASGGCRNVEFYEMQHVSSRLMASEADRTDVHAQQKVWYSREGATGGIGSTGAGGCGCSN
jgi:hypothetical protein